VTIVRDRALPTPSTASIAPEHQGFIVQNQVVGAEAWLLHNHPSGDPTPSRADIEMTKAVARALETVGVTLHDHVIVGRKGHSSFRSLGLI